ncbi:toxin YdaT family protein [Citrobacter werkmanii]|uniref:toxin YdaT family protein n=1 Tax=Citrobacter werkmanii TaxID=67827 RepID=UPI00300C505F
MISSLQANSALAIWSRDITQEQATLLITESFFGLTDHPDLAISQIVFTDGTVDHAAWSRNRINIFQRWRKCQTSEQCEKFEALIPAIISAIEKNAPALHKQITASDSLDYLVSRVLKENTEAVSAALNGASLHDFERECDEAELAINALRNAYRQQHPRHDQ